MRNSLRMRPDRIVVGECRGGESLDMLQAMNTGHDGSLTTLHANSPRDAISRLETLVLMAGMDLPLRAIREQIASAVDLIVQIDPPARRHPARHSRHRGARAWRATPWSCRTSSCSTSRRAPMLQGKFLGVQKSTGLRPRFTDKFEEYGIAYST